MVTLPKSKEFVMIASKITSKGQVTIPKKIRDFLNLDVSDRIEFTLLEDGNVLISSEKKPAKSLFGMFSHKKRANPVSLEEMENAIRDRRKKRGEP
mgnify:CR=1 FL=1|jgi:antitoxin PrlF